MPYDNSIPGWFTKGDLAVLENISVHVPKNGRIVEVGSLYGRSSVAWAMSCDPSVEIVCIDLFPERKMENHKFSEEVSAINGFPTNGKVYNVKEEFEKNTRAYPNIKMIRGYSPNCVHNIDLGPIDVFFLDALHSNPGDWENLCYFVPRVKVGGFICGHDYHAEQFPDIVENVARLEKLLGSKAVIPRPGYGAVWYIKVLNSVSPNDMI